jgi:hypothetical protein
MPETEHQWTVHALRAVVFAMLEERDRRYEQRFQDQQLALTKAEAVMEKRLSGLNELRAALEDQAKLLMPRAESNARYDGLVAKLDNQAQINVTTFESIKNELAGLSKRLDLREGEIAGSKENRGDSRATWAIAIAVATGLAQVILFYAGK